MRHQAVVYRPVIIVVEGNGTLCSEARLSLVARGYNIKEVLGELELRGCFSGRAPAIILLGAQGDSLRRTVDLMHRIRDGHDSIPIIVAARNGSEELAVAAFRAGVADYLREPVADADLVVSVDRIIQRTPPPWVRSSRCLGGEPMGPVRSRAIRDGAATSSASRNRQPAC